MSELDSFLLLDKIRGEVALALLAAPSYVHVPSPQPNIYVHTLHISNYTFYTSVNIELKMTINMTLIIF